MICAVVVIGDYIFCEGYGLINKEIAIIIITISLFD
jgi:hypothetical protein